MVQGIVIPRDGGGEPRVRELSGLQDFQDATGGWIEPVELDTLGATIYVSEGVGGRSVINSRATALRWFFSSSPAGALILGDAVVVGDNRVGGDDVPSRLIHGLLLHHEFVVQISPNGTQWYDTPASFSSIFDAAIWALLIDNRLVRGVAIRIEALDACGEYAQQDALW